MTTAWKAKLNELMTDSETHYMKIEFYTKQLAQDQALSDPKAADKERISVAEADASMKKIKGQCMMLNDNWD